MSEEDLMNKESDFDVRRSAHPFAMIFHLLFKGAGVFSYLFLGLFVQNPVIQYIIIILCDAFDFWTVKNVTGRLNNFEDQQKRLLVGLRWWSTFTPSGREVYRFESISQPNSRVDSTIFWFAQLGVVGVWGFFAGVNIMTFSLVDFILAFVGFLLSFINLYGFYKCSKDQQKNMKKNMNKMQHLIASKSIQMTMIRKK